MTTKKNEKSNYTSSKGYSMTLYTTDKGHVLLNNTLNDLTIADLDGFAMCGAETLEAALIYIDYKGEL